MFRGILSTMYLEMNKNLNAKKIYDFLKRYHKKNPFVKIQKFNAALGRWEIVNTNYCKIGIFKDRIKNKVIIISVLDNLVKGASGQAVQNMNVAFNLKESTGLIWKFYFLFCYWWLCFISAFEGWIYIWL